MRECEKIIFKKLVPACIAIVDGIAVLRVYYITNPHLASLSKNVYNVVEIALTSLELPTILKATELNARYKIVQT